MSTIAAMLQAASGPLVKHALTALGVGIVSYVGVEIALDSMLDLARNAWSGFSGDLAAYLQFAGVNHAMAILAGAMTARLALSSLKAFRLL